MKEAASSTHMTSPEHHGRQRNPDPPRDDRGRRGLPAKPSTGAVSRGPVRTRAGARMFALKTVNSDKSATGSSGLSRPSPQCDVSTQRGPTVRPTAAQHRGMSPLAPPHMYGALSKLVISENDDPLEMEADRVADRVLAMGGQDTRLQRYTPMQTGVSVQLGPSLPCALGRDNSSPRGTDRLDERIAIQCSGSRTRSAVPPAFVTDVLDSGGVPLDLDTRSFMEQRFDHDFSDVRLHTGSAAETSAAALSALAYTIGNHIVFGHQRFAPATSEGRRLLAHELTHVVQQRRSANVALVQRSPAGPVAGVAPIVANETTIESYFERNGKKMVRIQVFGTVGDALPQRPGLEKKYPSPSAIGLAGHHRFHIAGPFATGAESGIVYAPGTFNLSQTKIVENSIDRARTAARATGDNLTFDFIAECEVLGDREGVQIRKLDKITWSASVQRVGTTKAINILHKTESVASTVSSAKKKAAAVALVAAANAGKLTSGASKVLTGVKLTATAVNALQGVVRGAVAEHVLEDAQEKATRCREQADEFRVSVADIVANIPMLEIVRSVDLAKQQRDFDYLGELGLELEEISRDLREVSEKYSEVNGKLHVQTDVVSRLQQAARIAIDIPHEETQAEAGTWWIGLEPTKNQLTSAYMAYDEAIPTVNYYMQFLDGITNDITKTTWAEIARRLNERSPSGKSGGAELEPLQ